MFVMMTYLNQSAQLERFQKDDDYGNPIFESPVTIKCRRQPIGRFERSSFGDSVVPKTVYYTDRPVAVGDKLDGYTVLDVPEMVDLSGMVVGYKAVV